MVLFDDLPVARRACSAILIPLLSVTLLLVIWLLPSHARACGNAALCGDHIDAFFLPLIASSLTGAPAAGAAAPVADMPATALPDKPVIIRPPPRTSPSAETGMPGWRVRVEQQLVTGRLTDGGMQSSMPGPLWSACEHRVIPARGRAARNPACLRFFPIPGLLAYGIWTMAWTFRPLPGGLSAQYASTLP